MSTRQALFPRHQSNIAHTMTPFGLSRSGVTLLAASAVCLAVGCSLRVEGRAGRLVRQEVGRQQLAPEGQDGKPSVPVCGAADRDRNVHDLKLTANRGESLKFMCAASKKLAPPAESNSNFESVYQSVQQGDTRSCNTTSPVLLTGVVTDATLTSGADKDRQVTDAEPVYTFLYKSEQAEAKYLCYTCNGDPDGTVESLSASTGTGSSKPECTVYIEVRADPKPPTGSSTVAPNPTSDARAMTASAVTAGFLVIFCF